MVYIVLPSSNWSNYPTRACSIICMTYTTSRRDSDQITFIWLVNWLRGAELKYISEIYIMEHIVHYLVFRSICSVANIHFLLKIWPITVIPVWPNKSTRVSISILSFVISDTNVITLNFNRFPRLIRYFLLFRNIFKVSSKQHHKSVINKRASCV